MTYLAAPTRVRVGYTDATLQMLTGAVFASLRTIDFERPVSTLPGVYWRVVKVFDDSVSRDRDGVTRWLELSAVDGHDLDPRLRPVELPRPDALHVPGCCVVHGNYWTDTCPRC